MDNLINENVAIEKEKSITAPFLVSTYIDRNTRRKLEDRFVVETDLNKAFDLDLKHQYKYFAIFDGHVNDLAAEYCKNNLHLNLIQNENFKNGQISLALKETFLKTDKDFCEELLKDSKKSGCTALCCVVEDNRKIYLAWAGDSASIITRNGNPTHLTKIHSAEVLEERERIKKMGGESIHTDVWRVMGILAVSRSIGDPDYKPFVTAEPDIVELELDGSEDFLVLASDGLWDTLNPVDASMIIYQYLAYNADKDEATALSLASKVLVENSIEEGSSDNITAIILFLKDLKNISFPTEKITEFSNIHSLNGNSEPLENGNSEFLENGNNQNGFSKENGFSKNFPLNVNAPPFEPNFNNISLSGISSIRALQEQAMNDACHLNINITSNEDEVHDDNLCVINDTSFNENTEDLPSLLPTFNEQLSDSKKEDFSNDSNTAENNEETDETERELDEERVLVDEDENLDKEVIINLSDKTNSNEKTDIFEKIDEAQKIKSVEDLLMLDETNLETTTLHNLEKKDDFEEIKKSQEININQENEELIDISKTEIVEDKNTNDTQIDHCEEVNCFEFESTDYSNNDSKGLINCDEINMPSSACKISPLDLHAQLSMNEKAFNSEGAFNSNSNSNEDSHNFNQINNENHDEFTLNNNINEPRSTENQYLNECKINNKEENDINLSYDNDKTVECEYSVIPTESKASSIEIISNSNEDLIEKNNDGCFENTPVSPFEHLENDEDDEKNFDNADSTIIESLQKLNLNSEESDSNNVEDKLLDNKQDETKSEDTSFEFIEKDNLDKSLLNCINVETTCYQTPQGNFSKIGQENSVYENANQSFEELNSKGLNDLPSKNSNSSDESFNLENDILKFNLKNENEEISNHENFSNSVNALNNFTDLEKTDLNMKSMEIVDDNIFDQTLVYGNEKESSDKNYDELEKEEKQDSEDSETSIDSVKFEGNKQDLVDFVKTSNVDEVINAKSYDLNSEKNIKNTELDSTIILDESSKIVEKVDDLVVVSNNLNVENPISLDKKVDNMENCCLNSENQETNVLDKCNSTSLIVAENSINQFTLLNMNNDQKNDKHENIDVFENENVSKELNSVELEKNATKNKENEVEKNDEIKKVNGFLTEKENEFIGQNEDIVCQNKLEVINDNNSKEESIENANKKPIPEKTELNNKVKKDLSKPLTKTTSNTEEKKLTKKVEAVTRTSSALLKNKLSLTNKTSQLKSAKDLKTNSKEIASSASLKKNKPTESLVSKTVNATKVKTLTKTTSTLPSRISSSTLPTKKSSLPSTTLKSADTKKPLIGKTSSTLTSRVSSKTLSNTSTDKSKVITEKPISSRVITSTTSSRVNASANTRPTGASAKSTTSLPKTTVKSTSTVSTNRVSTSRPSTLNNKYANIPSKVTTYLASAKTSSHKPVSSTINNKNDAPLLKKTTTSKINIKPSLVSNKLTDAKPKVSLTRPKTLNKTASKPSTNTTSKITSASLKTSLKKEKIVINKENDQGEDKNLANSEAKSVISNSQSINGHLNNPINGSSQSENTINQTSIPTSKSRDKLTNSLKAELEAAMELNGSPI